MHVFAYAGNNPVVMKDPDGQKIVVPLIMFRQSDYSSPFLGGKETYDDGNWN
jgi:hypothetical protein